MFIFERSNWRLFNIMVTFWPLWWTFHNRDLTHFSIIGDFYFRGVVFEMLVVIFIKVGLFLDHDFEDHDPGSGRTF